MRFSNLGSLVPFEYFILKQAYSLFFLVGGGIKEWDDILIEYHNYGLKFQSLVPTIYC